MADQWVKKGETIKEKNEIIEELSIRMGLMGQEIKNWQKKSMIVEPKHILTIPVNTNLNED